MISHEISTTVTREVADPEYEICSDTLAVDVEFTAEIVDGKEYVEITWSSIPLTTEEQCHIIENEIDKYLKSLTERDYDEF